MLVRYAHDHDAVRATDVVRRSIAELCVADYGNDPQVLARWLANKTVENFRHWIGNSDRSVYVAALDDGQLSAVSMVAWRGEILLNYVAPEARFLGASKALVAHMENHFRARGVEEVALFSTNVAARFYRSLGYEGSNRVESRFGTAGAIKMAKRLG